jgi:hypothetical protein
MPVSKSVRRTMQATGTLPGKKGGRPATRPTERNSCIAANALLITFLWAVLPYSLGAQKGFSDWNQTSGYKRIEYRWRQNDTKGCDVEYRNLDERDHKKYKGRIVYQVRGDEQIEPYTVVSFADPTPPPVEKIAVCTEVTDVSLTRF